MNNPIQNVMTHPLAPWFAKARFMKSAATLTGCPVDTGREAAFAGRSNAGKSSAINALCQQKKLAYSSKTPGRTQLINFFSISDQHRLVDLPGYGFAKVQRKTQSAWGQLINDYVHQRDSLTGLVLLMDCRHPLKEQDQSLIHWTRNRGINLHILLTKADKLGKNKAKTTLAQTKNWLVSQNYEASLQLFSAAKSQGVEECYEILNTWIQLI